MDRTKLFERTLLGKQVGGNGLIVILDTIYLVSGVFFGRMEYTTFIKYVLLINMLGTCILFHNMVISRGELSFELNTEKIVYYPTTRLQYLLHKYAKALIFACIQSGITLIGFWFGYYGNRGQLDWERMIGGLLTLTISILLTSGFSVVSMHLMPMGIYLSLLLYLPLSFGAAFLHNLLYENQYIFHSVLVTIYLLLLSVILLWGVLLWLGLKVFERKK